MFRTIVPGRETLSPGHDLPRHRHLEPYALVVIAGAFEQTSYAGRVIVSAGDMLVQPTLDCHANRLTSRGAQILRLPWPHVEGPGGVYRLGDLDGLVRLAERSRHLDVGVDLNLNLNLNATLNLDVDDHHRRYCCRHCRGEPSWSRSTVGLRFRFGSKTTSPSRFC